MQRVSGTSTILVPISRCTTSTTSTTRTAELTAATVRQRPTLPHCPDSCKSQGCRRRPYLAKRVARDSQGVDRR